MKRNVSFLLFAMATKLCCSTVQAQQHTEGLKDAYASYFNIGVAVNMKNIGDELQVALIKKDFNSITAENAMKPVSVHPSKERWTWNEADSVANFCRRNGIKLRGHCLMWHNQIGNWMYQDAQGNLLSKEEFYKNMKEHIFAVVNRYKDVVYAWDVVNEAVSDDDAPYRNTPMYQIAGEEYIRMAFVWAHEADPNAILFYNDYNAAIPAKRDRIYNMVKKLQAEGAPIQAIGMQGHFSIYGPSVEEVDAAIQKYSELVGTIHITELDIRANQEMGGNLNSSKEGEQITPEVKARFEKQYVNLFKVLRKHKKVVTCVTFWNLSDKDSWVGERNYPLLFDSNYQPKDAYYLVKNFNLKED